MYTQRDRETERRAKIWSGYVAKQENSGIGPQMNKIVPYRKTNHNENGVPKQQTDKR